jgi:hypothetical protein
VKGTKTYKQERRERIKESRYNREYERGNSGVSRESAKERKMMARFRWGNEEKENRYWTERRCRMSYEERETMSTCGTDVTK